MLILGSCHCENITFKLIWQPEPTEIPARACTCSFCRKHGGVWTACHAGSLKVTIKDAQRVSTYRFGTETADFHICASCGVVPLASCLIDGRLYAVVNVNTFEGIDPALLKRSPVTFDEESHDDRLARRQRNWIADVVIAQSTNAARA